MDTLRCCFDARLIDIRTDKRAAFLECRDSTGATPDKRVTDDSTFAFLQLVEQPLELTHILSPLVEPFVNALFGRDSID